MKNKTKTYILLMAVLIVWGIIGFKTVGTLKPDVSKSITQETMVLFSPKATVDAEPFSIQRSERDPFLGTLYIEKISSTNPKISKPKEVFVWLPIIYHGMVAKQDSKEKTCVLSISGQQHIMKIGQETNEVKLLKATNSEILVSYKGAKKTIAKI